MLAKPSLTLKRHIKAPPAKVYGAWTDAQKIVGWFGPANTVPGTVRADLDVRTGGRYTIAFKTDDGEQHEVGGVYREVVRDQRLVFTWAWHTTPERQSLVTVTVAPDGDGGTHFTLHHEQFFDQQARDGHERGWTGTMDSLEKYLTA